MLLDFCNRQQIVLFKTFFFKKIVLKEFINFPGYFNDLSEFGKKLGIEVNNFRFFLTMPSSNMPSNRGCNAMRIMQSPLAHVAHVHPGVVDLSHVHLGVGDLRGQVAAA